MSRSRLPCSIATCATCSVTDEASRISVFHSGRPDHGMAWVSVPPGVLSSGQAASKFGHRISAVIALLLAPSSHGTDTTRA